MALRLHAITLADAHLDLPGPGGSGPPGGGLMETETYAGNGLGVSLMPFRDLCAVVSDQGSFVLDDASPSEVARHRSIVDAVFQRAPVVPAPVGVVFRGTDVLKRWMELHYVSLSGALEFVEDRVAARVHISRADAKPGDEEAGADLAANATEAFRALRRNAVASLPLRLEKVTGLMLSASFLVERDLWKDFLRAVQEQHEAHHKLRFEITGPWAPYDFVRMQFGG
ncbi:MAG TPA: GvpL/GvpF family gas vesicle protein [Gemmatimonadaceae bacterium]|jgi:hypothetical protein|nr:GvpL/GvpF family gas vesicle protein [Gemmatimonadaceae bacterium]